MVGGPCPSSNGFREAEGEEGGEFAVEGGEEAAWRGVIR